ncbi:hypothetical protein Pmani_030716 [Petrolisthes manimaculis]|uniref:Uncharacterized protein n=1 Tax=Petrolisthes manimaculis TaxID=1843537 RepID=A0AAE1TVM4_9EUCA|nr:hypothetical protein Pmani_030716 [Petrolisthes manimaculis]
MEKERKEQKKKEGSFLEADILRSWQDCRRIYHHIKVQPSEQRRDIGLLCYLQKIFYSLRKASKDTRLDPPKAKDLSVYTSSQHEKARQEKMVKTESEALAVLVLYLVS